MNGSDIQQYEYFVARAEKSGFKLSTSGERIVLHRKKDNKLYGYFNDINDALQFIYGYDAAKSEIIGE